MPTGRIRYIDFLKFIGLTGIIIAHVGPPGWIMALRSFDVPFMVILSAILGERSYQRYENNKNSAVHYIVSRIKRLVFPTWIFLAFYFCIYFGVTGEVYDIKYYMASFALTRYGIGYVWIILIYLYCAVLIPLFSRIKLSRGGMVCIAVVYAIYEIMYYFRIGANHALMDTVFYYIVPYGVLTYLGYNYHRMKKTQKWGIAAASFVMFAGFGLYYWMKYGSPQLVQIAKYPPRLYYLGYGTAVSFFLILVCESRDFRIYDNRMIRFVSKNSMWIYLWHILILSAYKFLKLPEIWFVKLLIVYVSAMGIVFTVNRLLDGIEKKKAFKAVKYLRG